MSEKLVMFCKKPLLFISTFFVIISAGLLIAFGAIVPNGKWYEIKDSAGAYDFEFKVEFINSNSLRVWESVDSAKPTSKFYNYRIRKNVLYLSINGNYDAIGDINAYYFEPYIDNSNNIFTTANVDGLTFKCQSNCLLMGISIFLVSMFGLLLFVSLYFTFVYKEKERIPESAEQSPALEEKNELKEEPRKVSTKKTTVRKRAKTKKDIS